MNTLRRHLLLFVLGLFLSGCGAPSNQHTQISHDDALAKAHQKIPADTYFTNQFLQQAATGKPLVPSSPDHIRVGMPWILNDESALWYIAVDKGFFRDMGIDAELVPGGPGKDPLALMVGGSLDIAITPGGSFVISLIASPTGAKVTAICTLLKDSQYSWITLDHSVSNNQVSHKELKPEDLIGQKIGVQADGQRYVDFITQRFKLPTDQIKLVQVGFSIDPLVSGAVDFYSGWIQNQPRFLEQQGYKNWTALRFKDLGWTEEGDVSVVMRSLVEKNSGLVARYVYALIEGIDFTVEPGEFIALIGASGCGKTTLLRMCAGLEEPSSGLIEIFGKPPASAASAHEIGLAFQRPALVPSRTALENVRLTLKITAAKDGMDPLVLLTHFGLAEAVNRYPHQLSGGMQQRVNIACAIVHQPALLPLDEPFGALDEITRERLVDWLAGVLRESSRTTLLVTHSVEEAITLSTRVFVMSRRPGRIAAEIKVPLPPVRDFQVRQSEQFLELVRATREALYSAILD